MYLNLNLFSQPTVWNLLIITNIIIVIEDILLSRLSLELVVLIDPVLQLADLHSLQGRHLHR